MSSYKTNDKTAASWRGWRLTGMAALALCAAMTACTDDETTTDTATTAIGITAGSDPASQTSRITVYNPALALTRGTEATPAADYAELGQEPAIDASLPVYEGEQAALQAPVEAKSRGYVLTGGQGAIHLYGCAPVYITGDVTTHNLQHEGGQWSDVSDVYVMPGASLTLTNGNLTTGVRIHAFGELAIAGEGDCTVSQVASIAAKGDIHYSGNLAILGKVTCRDLTVRKKLQVGQDARLKAKCIEVKGETLSEGDEATNIGQGAEISVLSYFLSPKVYNQRGAMYFYPGAMADVKTRLKMTSEGAGFFAYTPDATPARALIRTTKFEIEGSSDVPEFINTMFSGALKLVYTELVNMQPAAAEKFLPSADNYYIAADPEGCNPGNAEPDAPSFDPEVLIESPETHTHTHLSATCVQDVNGRAYVCYHLNEAYADVSQWVENGRHQGCAEMIQVSDTKAEISSWMMNDIVDFNHLLVSGQTLYAVGDSKKGGALCSIQLDANGGFGKYELGEGGTMDVKNLDFASGNCIVRDGQQFHVAGTTGFQTFDSQLSLTGTIATAGIAKHIAAHGSGFITLNLDAQGLDASDATVTVYSPWGTAVSTFHTGMITPTNGKNTIASDGQYIYVCCGQNGVKKYSAEGQLLGEFNYIAYKQQTKPDYKGKPCANGVAVDSRYVYSAYGEAGLIVLDKQTMNKVGRYARTGNTAKSGAYSANYVQKVGQMIYVAYGRNGLEVLKVRQ